MHQYCRAYPLCDLRGFSGWTEQPTTSGEALADESIVYLWDDFTVVESPIQGGGAIFDQVTPEWQDYCTKTLHFEIPEDLRYAYTEGTAVNITATQSETTSTQ